MFRPVVIEVQGVTKEVQDPSGMLTILSDIGFTLRQGETAAIVGASGSGKSTLLSIVAGLDVPTRGIVSLAGTDLFALDEDARAAIHPTVDIDKLRRCGIEAGMHPLRMAGVIKVAEGVTTLDEVLRSTPAWEVGDRR